MQTNQNECQCKFKTVIIIILCCQARPEKHLLEVAVMNSFSIEKTGESWNGNRTLCKGEMVDEGTFNMEINFTIPSTVSAL
jgi:hypothetical protein